MKKLIIPVLSSLLIFSCSQKQHNEPDGTIIYESGCAYTAKSELMRTIDWNKVSWRKLKYDDSTWVWENELLMYCRYQKVAHSPKKLSFAQTNELIRHLRENSEEHFSFESLVMDCHVSVYIICIYAIKDAYMVDLWYDNLEVSIKSGWKGMPESIGERYWKCGGTKINSREILVENEE